MLLGVDVSKWQGEMEWQRAADAGAKFAFIRAGSISVGGTLYTDYHYMRNVTLAPDHFPVGCYWYFRPQHDPVSQADYFCDLLDGEAWIMPPVLDLETDGGLSMAGVTQAAKSFILQVYNRLQVWPLLYSRSLWLNANVNEDEIWDYVEYWCARYKAGLTGPWSVLCTAQKAGTST
ncbi:MAG: glycoside hydrolase family 25 protein [Planctomycetota bacterium]|jgi:lysozyme